MKQSIIIFSILFLFFLTSCHQQSTKKIELADKRKHELRADSGKTSKKQKHENDSVHRPEADTLKSAPAYEKRHYSYRELQRIMQIMERKWLKGTPANGVMGGFGLGENDITVWLIFDSPRNRRLVREHLMDGPFMKFEGPTTPGLIKYKAVRDTLGLYLTPIQHTYPHDVRKVGAVLHNEGNQEVIYGEEYDVAFLDSQGKWRALPMTRFIHDMAIGVGPGQTIKSTANLSPDAFPTPSGRYRYYLPVMIDRKKVWLMTEFAIE